MAGARQALKKILDGLGETSRFVASGKLTPVLPGLEVKGVGSIGTPVSETDAKRLIALAVQAPYGRGEDTILDLKVRRVWQIEPGKVALRNPEWPAHLAAILKAAQEELGVAQKVTASLYKLLIYEKGGFFAPHRDTEKTPGMFATLVIGLPSRHDGGALVVEHDGQTRKIDFGGADSEFNTNYAAFYADCRHEIKPVTAGYRVALVYNLAIAGKKAQPNAPRHADAVAKAADSLQALFADQSNPLTKIVIPFQHQYTKAGLDPNQWKGADRSRAEVLTRAAESLDYQCYFALLTHHQSGSPDYSTFDSRPSRWRRSYGRSDDDDDASDAEMEEIFEESRVLDHWLDSAGRKPALGEIHFQDAEILSRDAREGWSVEKEVREATGNEGATMDLWYRQAAVVIWPQDRYFDILAGEGQDSALPALESMSAGALKAAKLKDCRAFARAIIAAWEPGKRVNYQDMSFSDRMLKTLEKLGDATLFERFLRDVFPKDFVGSEGDSLIRLLERHGWKSHEGLLDEFLARQRPDHPSGRLQAILAICVSLCLDPPPPSPERRAVCESVARELAGVLERWDAHRDEYGRNDKEERQHLVANVVRILAEFATGEALNQFLDRALADPTRYDLHRALIPAVKAIAKWSNQVPTAKPAFTRLREHCLAQLRAATAKTIEPPKDWTRDAKIACTCKHCVELVQFLLDPTRREARFPLREDLRGHVQAQLRLGRCDCSSATQRTGSPYSLVCTKNQASYDAWKKQYDLDNALIADLEAIAPAATTTPVTAVPRRRTPKK